MLKCWSLQKAFQAGQDSFHCCFLAPAIAVHLPQLGSVPLYQLKQFGFYAEWSVLPSPSADSTLSIGLGSQPAYVARRNA